MARRHMNKQRHLETTPRKRIVVFQTRAAATRTIHRNPWDDQPSAIETAANFASFARIYRAALRHSREAAAWSPTRTSLSCTHVAKTFLRPKAITIRDKATENKKQTHGQETALTPTSNIDILRSTSSRSRLTGSKPLGGGTRLPEAQECECPFRIHWVAGKSKKVLPFFA